MQNSVEPRGPAAAAASSDPEARRREQERARAQRRRNALDPEAKKRMLERKRQRHVERLAAMSPEELLAFREANRIKAQQRRNMMTEEQREMEKARKRKRSASFSDYGSECSGQDHDLSTLPTAKRLRPSPEGPAADVTEDCPASPMLQYASSTAAQRPNAKGTPGCMRHAAASESTEGHQPAMPTTPNIGRRNRPAARAIGFADKPQFPAKQQEAVPSLAYGVTEAERAALQALCMLAKPIFAIPVCVG